jgi:hypothetical protein
LTGRAPPAPAASLRSMSQLEFSVQAAKVDVASLNRIIEALRPITVEVAQNDLIRFGEKLASDLERGVGSGATDSAIQSAEKAIAAGGEVSMVIRRLKERSGVVHENLGLGEPVPLRKIENCVSAEVAVASYSGAIGDS